MINREHSGALGPHGVGFLFLHTPCGFLHTPCGLVAVLSRFD